MKNAPDGFEWKPITDLKFNDFFFFRAGGKRMCLYILSKKEDGNYKVVAIKPNGVNYTKYLPADAIILAYQ